MVINEVPSNTPAAVDMVEDACREIHLARESRRMTEQRRHELGRCLTQGCAVLTALRPAYCPEDDRRVLWARGVLASACGGCGEGPTAELEAIALMLLGIWTPGTQGRRKSED